MTFFSILTSCDSFLARSGPNAPAVFPRRACPILPVNRDSLSLFASQYHCPGKVRTKAATAEETA